MQDYITLATKAEIETTIKHSQFIAVASPVTTEQEALDIIAGMKNSHPTANHHVYAYRLREGNRVRYSDDGEPAKTAGVPVLSMLEGREIVDAIVVVVRYFGGTLLGTGGLVRAYGDSARLAIEQAKLHKRTLCAVYEVEVEYSLYERICRLIESIEGIIENCEFSDKTLITVALPVHQSAQLIDETMRITNGRTTPQFKQNMFR